MISSLYIIITRLVLLFKNVFNFLNISFNYHETSWNHWEPETLRRHFLTIQDEKLRSFLQGSGAFPFIQCSMEERHSIYENCDAIMSPEPAMHSLVSFLILGVQSQWLREEILQRPCILSFWASQIFPESQ